MLAIALAVGVGAGQAARAQDAVNEAKALIESGRLDEAAEGLRAQDQSDPEILFLEAEIAALQERWDAAEALYCRRRPPRYRAT